MRDIEIPENCPACEGILTSVNEVLYCTNKDCPAKSAKRLEHFVKTLKIKGLGPSTLDKLEISTFIDLFYLELEDFRERIGSEKIAAKIFAEIEKAKLAPADMLLPAFGIPLIGKTATEKLSTVCKSIFDISKDSCTKAGLGPKATENLVLWMETEFPEIVALLPFSFEFLSSKPHNNNTGEVVCISGKLKTFKTKSEAEEALTAAGFIIKTSVTKDVTILVNESGIDSAKTKKAEDLGIKIVTDILTLIGDK